MLLPQMGFSDLHFITNGDKIGHTRKSLSIFFERKQFEAKKGVISFELFLELC